MRAKWAGDRDRQSENRSKSKKRKEGEGSRSETVEGAEMDLFELLIGVCELADRLRIGRGTGLPG